MSYCFTLLPATEVETTLRRRMCARSVLYILDHSKVGAVLSSAILHNEPLVHVSIGTQAQYYCAEVGGTTNLWCCRKPMRGETASPAAAAANLAIRALTLL